MLYLGMPVEIIPSFLIFRQGYAILYTREH